MNTIGNLHSYMGHYTIALLRYCTIAREHIIVFEIYNTHTKYKVTRFIQSIKACNYLQIYGKGVQMQTMALLVQEKTKRVL